ncbi:UNVERIFIED_CONTAM: prolyl oligopeptidase family protein [Acetivibrio alkalicellulosi]
MIKYLCKTFSAILIFSIILSIVFIPVTVLADSSYNVSYSCQSRWKNIFMGEITVKNTGEKELTHWKMEFELNGEILHISNANIIESDNSRYVIAGEQYNAKMPFGKTASNIIMEHNKFNLFPNNNPGRIISSISRSKGRNKCNVNIAPGETLKIHITYRAQNKAAKPKNFIITDLYDEISVKSKEWNDYIAKKEGELIASSIAELLFFTYTRFEADMLYAKGYENIVRNPVGEYTNARYENVEIDTPEGHKLRGLFFPVRRPKGTLIALHGRGDDMYNTIKNIEFLMESGYQVLMFNGRFWNHYQNPSQYFGTIFDDVDDIESAVRYLKTRKDVDSRKIGLYGFSNGANKSIIAGKQIEGIKVSVLDAPSALPFFDEDEEISPPGWLYIRDDFMKLYEERLGITIEDFKEGDYIYCMTNNSKPVLFLHGLNDPWVKKAEIEKLYSVAPGVKEVHYFPNSGHTDAMHTEDKHDYINAVISFLDKYLYK